MKFLVVVALAATLGGCAASRQEVAVRLGDQFVGHNIDSLVMQFGPPTSMFKMNSGQGSYVWQLTAVTDIAADRGYRRVVRAALPDGKNPQFALARGHLSRAGEGCAARR